MHVITYRSLTVWCATNRPPAQVVRLLHAWHESCKHSRWHTFAELKASFPTCDSVRGCAERVVFDIASHRLIAEIRYAADDRNGSLFVKFIGSHSEYDALCKKNRQCEVNMFSTA